MGSLFNSSFKHVGRASLAGSGAQAYFKVQGYPGYPVIISRFEYGASEKIQVVEAFNEYIHVYAFGRAASQVQIQGHCLNVGDDFQASAPVLKSVYQQELRAFKAAQNGGMISIAGPVGVLKGIATNLSFAISAGQDGVINFGMNFVVLDGTSESSVGSSQGGGGSGSGSGGSGTSAKTNQDTTTADTTSDTTNTSNSTSGEGAEYAHADAVTMSENAARWNDSGNSNSAQDYPSGQITNIVPTGNSAINTRGAAVPFEQ